MGSNSEPDLPVTPTNEGRRPRISNFGYNVPYRDLWPLLVGVVASMFIVMLCITGIIRAHWSLLVFLCALPGTAAHLYVKMFVEDALPHTQQDTLARVVSLEPDFDSPVFARFPLIPKFRTSLTMAADPHVDDGLHPLVALKREYERLNKGARGGR